MFRRNRFGELIARQLDIFGEENHDLLLEIAEYRERWRRASREGAEEAYGDEQDRVDWAAEALSALCDRYADEPRRGDGGGVPPRVHEGRAPPASRARRRVRGADRHRPVTRRRGASPQA